jgi:hypothetical protein
MRLLLPLVLGVACTWISSDELGDRLDDKVGDADGDGFVSLAAGGDDCDDTQAAVNPGAVEACDTPDDDDCDGGTDQEGALGCVAWHYDGDGDGFGIGTGECWCRAQEATAFDAVVGGDCDDTNAGVNPGEAERCDPDAVDEDCDGLSDDDAGAEAEGRTPYFPDADGDGFGDAADPGTPSCVALAPPWSASDADCDDASPNVFPGAAEGAADGVDQDCDGYETCHVDADGDTYRSADGATVASADLACDGPGESAATVADDCDDADPTVPRPEEWDRRDDDCDGASDDLDIATFADGVLYGATSALGLGASHTLSLGGDIDADGLDDLVLLSETGSTGSGWVVGGAAALGAADDVSVLATASLVGQTSYVLGHVAGPMVDLTGDSVADLLLGGSYGSYGRAWLLDGTRAAGAVRLETDAAARWDGDSANDLLKWAVAGDVDGDGVADVVTGAVYDTFVGSITTDAYTGNVAVFTDGAWAGGFDLSGAHAEIHGSTASDYLGQSLAVGDVTGDGYADIVAGAPGEDGGGTNAGAIYLFAGNAGASWADDRAEGAATAWLVGSAASLALGNDPIPAPGDLAGAGRASLAVASSVSGEVWVFLDPVGLSGAVVLADADASWADTPSSFASALASGSDLDGDGAADLAIGSRGDDTRFSNAGAVFLFYGGGTWTRGMTSADADVSLYGAASSDALGSGIASGGDVNGDGRGDLLLGAPGVDTAITGGGAAYLVVGR